MSTAILSDFSVIPTAPTIEQGILLYENSASGKEQGDII